jgi:hypothetical protein
MFKRIISRATLLALLLSVAGVAQSQSYFDTNTSGS